MQLRILSRNKVAAAVTMSQAIAAMADAFAQLSSGRATVPLRVHQEAEGGVTLLMSAYLPTQLSVGVKIVTAYPENPSRDLPMIHALVMVLDAETGVPRALMEGAHLTALRTAAATGLATDRLARPDAGVLALFGAGGQARHQLEAVRAVRPIREVRIVARTAGSARRLAEEVEGVQVRVLEDRRAALDGADVVVAATTSTSPVFDGGDVSPGAHVNGVGSYTPSMQEVDAKLVARARVVVDSRVGALAEAGDLRIPLERGTLREADIAELGEVVSGTRPGRRSPEEITFFKSVGNAVQDAAVAAMVLDAAERRGLGRVIEL